MQKGWTYFTRWHLWAFNFKMRLLLPERPALTKRENREACARSGHRDKLHRKYRFKWERMTPDERHAVRKEEVFDKEQDFLPRPLMPRNNRPLDWECVVYKVTTETDEWWLGERGNSQDVIFTEILATPLTPWERQDLLDFMRNGCPLEGDDHAADLLAEIEDWFVQQIQAYNVGDDIEAALKRVPIPERNRENLLYNLYNYRKTLAGGISR